MPSTSIYGIINVAHYHQAAGRQPGGRIIQPGQEVVEVVTGGRGWIMDRSREVEIGPGALIWHVAGDQTIHRSEPYDPYRCLAVVFSCTGDGTRPAPHLTWWNDLASIRSFTRELVRRHLDETFDREALSAYAYGRLIFQARIGEQHQHGGNLPLGLLRVLELLDQHYQDELPVEDLAKRSGWSVPHLHAMFKQHLETTPHRYLLQRRIHRARELLATSTDKVKDIATACGFPSAASFCRTFKQAVGSSPEAYRRQHADPYEPG